MLEKSPEAKIKRLEHLRQGVPSIVACVGTIEDFKYDGKINWLLSGKEINYADNVDWNEKFEKLKKDGFENDGSGSYVISPVDNLDKYSRDYHDCTGLIVSGKDKETGKNLSFMSHQDPSYFLRDNGRNFPKDLIKRTKEIKERCEVETIDAVIFGGRYAKVKSYGIQDHDRDIFIEEYKKSIEFLSEKIKNEIGFEPLIIIGPKTRPGSDMVYYDNDTKKLYLVRDKSGLDAVESFMPSELEEKSKNWKPGEWGLPE